MSRLTSALLALALGLGLGAVRPAAAQPMQQGAPVTVPQRVTHPAYGRATGFDCVVEGLSVAVYPRRLMAFVDVAVHVRALHGGFCAVRADAVQAQSGKATPVGRFAAVFVENGQNVWPGEVTEFRAVGERLAPWIADLKPNEARTVVLRAVFEGDDGGKGEAADVLTRLRLQFSSFGPRLVPNAPVDLRVAFEPNVAGRVVATAANGNKPGPEPVAPGATYQVRQTLGKDALIPFIEWRYEGEGPATATAATALNSPLGLLEYLRHGLVRDMAAALASKDARRVAAAWDESFDLTFAAARSDDPLVAGVGLRAFAWLANGLNATTWRVRAAAEGGADEAVVVPDAVANELAKVVPNFQRAIGNWEPPSPVGPRGTRLVAAGFGDPGDNKRAADEAMGRFVRRLDQAKARRAPALFRTFAVPTPSTRALDASQVIEFRPSGPKLVSSARAGGGVALSPSRRVVRALTHPRRAWKPLLLIALLGGAAAGLAAALRSPRQRLTSAI